MAWKHPLTERNIVVGAIGEVTPFVFRDRLYRLENFMRFHDFSDKEHQYRFHEDGFRLRDVDEDRILSIPLLNHYFAVAFPFNNRVYVFAGDYGTNQPWWHIKKTVMICSDDLITWSEPKVVLDASPTECLFNYGICQARGKFYMLYETNDPQWPPFTLRFCESDDLINWRKLGPEHIYGSDKYTGGPALYYDHQEDYFYCLYVADMGNGTYENHITRSKNLITWQDAPNGRAIVTPDITRDVDADVWPGVKECSASDVELCEFEGKTHVYWIVGNQQGAGADVYGIFNGSMICFLRAFFE